MKKLIYFFYFSLFGICTMQAQTGDNNNRALWASIAKDPSAGAISLGDYKQHNNKVLISWRMLPGDDENTGFDLYRKIGTQSETMINGTYKFDENFQMVIDKINPIYATNYQDAGLKTSNYNKDITYRLTYTGSDETLATSWCLYLSRKEVY